MIAEALAVLNTEEERNSLRDFYKEYGGKLCAIALAALHNREDSEDAVQEMFLKIVKYPEKFFAIDVSKRLSYAVIVLKNVIKDLTVKKAKKDCEVLSDDIPENNVLMEDIIIGDISSEALVRFIRKMPETKRQAIILKTEYDLTTAEIADIMNISENTARKRISDAYKLIRGFVNGGV